MSMPRLNRPWCPLPPCGMRKWAIASRSTAAGRLCTWRRFMATWTLRNYCASTAGTNKILKWSGLYTRPGGGSFEQTLQIVVVVLVQATNRDLFLGTSQLSFYVAVFASGAGFQCQSAIGPELSLGAKTMRGLDQGHRQR